MNLIIIGINLNTVIKWKRLQSELLLKGAHVKLKMPMAVALAWILLTTEDIHGFQTPGKAVIGTKQKGRLVFVKIHCKSNRRALIVEGEEQKEKAGTKIYLAADKVEMIALMK